MAKIKIELLISASSPNLLEYNGTWLVARSCGSFELLVIDFATLEASAIIDDENNVSKHKNSV